MNNYLVILFQRMSTIVFEQKFNNCKRQSKQMYEFHFSDVFDSEINLSR